MTAEPTHDVGAAVLQNRRREPEGTSAAFYLLLGVGVLFLALFVVLPLVKLAT